MGLISYSVDLTHPDFDIDKLCIFLPVQLVFPGSQVLLMPTQVLALAIGGKHGGVVEGVIDVVGILHPGAFPGEGTGQGQVGAADCWVSEAVVPAGSHGRTWCTGEGR